MQNDLNSIKYRKTNKIGDDITAIVGRQNQMSKNQSILSDKLELSVKRSNQTLVSVVGQLKGLTLNKFCQNRWVYHQGTCYYFSKAQVFAIEDHKITFLHSDLVTGDSLLVRGWGQVPASARLGQPRDAQNCGGQQVPGRGQHQPH